MIKRRAGAVRHRAFLDRGHSDTTPIVDAEFADRPRRQVSAIVRRLIAVTDRTRTLRGGLGGRLFVSVAATHTYGLRVGDWVTDLPSTSFSAWLSKAGVTVTGAADVRRLRKSTKVEKAIAFGGRIADAADDHHEETFRGHYAQGSTLRVLSGEVIATAQQHWFDKALDGPFVLTATGILDQPDHLQALGLTAEQAEDLRQGELDMGVTHCRDPYSSPYSPQGELCAVAPLRCLECRNAWVLPSNLPQLLLFADHLDQLRNRLTPEHFAALWGQSYLNLHAILDQRTPAELTLARQHIADGASLHLPLTAHVEFDT